MSRWFRDLRQAIARISYAVFLGSSPFQAPAVYSLMSHLDFCSGVYYPRHWHDGIGKQHGAAREKFGCEISL